MSKRAAIEAEATRRIEEDCRQNMARARRADAFNAAMTRNKDRPIEQIIAEAVRIQVFIDGHKAS